MKKYILLLIIAVFVCGCKKEEAAPVAAKPAAVAAQPAKAAEDVGCEALAGHLKECEPFTCTTALAMEMFGAKITMHSFLTIKGPEDGKCVLVQEALQEAEYEGKIEKGEKEPVMTCRFDKTAAANVAAHYDTYFKSSGDFSTSVSIGGGGMTQKDTIDGKEVVNPLNDLLAKGVCKMENPDMSRRGHDMEEGSEIIEYGQDGTVTRYKMGPNGEQIKQK